jgi:hypothetical protein
MYDLIQDLNRLFPKLTFTSGQQFCWSPETCEIIYKNDTHSKKDKWSLMHETGHALLKHKTYGSDMNLLKLEVEAWEKAREISRQLTIDIDEAHIQDCLDSYRDWIYKRSICPVCTAKSIQQDDFEHYRCFNCHTSWKVSSSRFCRSYRKTKRVEQVSVFHLQTELK